MVIDVVPVVGALVQLVPFCVHGIGLFGSYILLVSVAGGVLLQTAAVLQLVPFWLRGGGLFGPCYCAVCAA